MLDHGGIDTGPALLAAAPYTAQPHLDNDDYLDPPAATSTSLAHKRMEPDFPSLSEVDAKRARISGFDTNDTNGANTLASCETVAASVFPIDNAWCALTCVVQKECVSDATVSPPPVVSPGADIIDPALANADVGAGMGTGTGAVGSGGATKNLKAIQPRRIPYPMCVSLFVA